VRGLGLERYQTVETLGFDYGQRHRVELECREGVRDALKHRFPRGRAASATIT
jgi:7-cyano-7-deazaguanine synthase